MPVLSALEQYALEFIPQSPARNAHTYTNAPAITRIETSTIMFLQRYIKTMKGTNTSMGKCNVIEMSPTNYLEKP